MSDQLINQPIQLGTACAAFCSSGQIIIGAVVHKRNDDYKIEWCDGHIDYYAEEQTITFINKAKRCIK